MGAELTPLRSRNQHVFGNSAVKCRLIIFSEDQVQTVAIRPAEVDIARSFTMKSFLHQYAQALHRISLEQLLNHGYLPERPVPTVSPAAQQSAKQAASQAARSSQASQPASDVCPANACCA